jgi:protein-tyrosine phosphatase
MDAVPDAHLEPPLRVDWLDQGDVSDDLPGRLGLTFLPGKHGASLRYPGRVYRRRLDDDLATLVGMGVARLVLLIEDGELARWGDLDLVERARGAGMRVDRFPMPDGGTPGSMSEMDRVVASVTDGRRTGDVAVACMGGVGRTGMVVACALVAAGWSTADAIRRVRRVRHPEAVETADQERFVADYEGHVAQGLARSGKVPR